MNGNVVAFRAKLDHKTHQWKMGRCDPNFLPMLLPKLPAIPQVYQALTGEVFDPGKTQLIDPDVISQLKASPYFQQALNLVCSRWVM